MSNRPQKFDPSKGMQGNIEDALWNNQYNSNEIFNEAGLRRAEDISNREPVEQNHTEDYLNLVEAQQDITELTLKCIELEARIKALEDR